MKLHFFISQTCKNCTSDWQAYAKRNEKNRPYRSEGGKVTPIVPNNLPEWTEDVKPDLPVFWTDKTEEPLAE